MDRENERRGGRGGRGYEDAPDEVGHRGHVSQSHSETPHKSVTEQQQPKLVRQYSDTSEYESSSEAKRPEDT
jgi:hypothetical protein